MEGRVPARAHFTTKRASARRGRCPTDLPNATTPRGARSAARICPKPSAVSPALRSLIPIARTVAGNFHLRVGRCFCCRQRFSRSIVPFQVNCSPRLSQCASFSSEPSACHRWRHLPSPSAPATRCRHGRPHHRRKKTICCESWTRRAAHLRPKAACALASTIRRKHPATRICPYQRFSKLARSRLDGRIFNVDPGGCEHDANESRQSVRS
jgi:hypothetical protein